MITSQRMAAVDANAAALGVPRKQLMESSGSAVARRVRSLTDSGAAVALVCGRGNNGGDAFVAARFLPDREVTVQLLGRPGAIRTDIARENWAALEAAEIPNETVTDSAAIDFGSPDLVVDAMLGTGVAGALREPERSAAERINGMRDAPTVVSVDVPSGVDADTGERTGGPDGIAVDADHVVTFHDTKPGLDRLNAAITVADIGIPRAAERFTGPGDLHGLSRDPRSHKGDNGAVLVVGGGPFTGAPALAARAALRAGADLVRVACPDAVADEVQGFAEDLIVHGVPGERLAPDHLDRILELAAGQDVVVIGPGLGDAAKSLELARRFLDEFDGRAVVDADALGTIPDVDTDAELICTPHQGELRRMGGRTVDDPDEREGLIREFAGDLGHTVLVKGRYDVVADADGERTRLNRTGDAGMTVGGTGDVLAGTVGAFAARTGPFSAAVAGAYVNGLAGEDAAKAYGDGLVATDLLDRIPGVMPDA